MGVRHLQGKWMRCYSTELLSSSGEGRKNNKGKRVSSPDAFEKGA
jgi:hypothetical protein